jgi:hypothetical protein
MTLDTVGEFDTRGSSFECRIVRVVFDPVRRKYRIGYGRAPTPATRPSRAGPTLIGDNHSRRNMPTAGLGRMTPTCAASSTRSPAHEQLWYTPRKEGSGDT